MKSKKITAILVGCGRFGFGGNLEKTSKFSYYYFLKKKKIIDLLALIEPNPTTVLLKTGNAIFKNLNPLEKKKIDIAYVVSSTESHFSVLKKISELSPSLIVAEKPLTESFEKSQEILKLIKKKQKKIIVNFSRRFIDFYHRIKKDLINQKIISFTIKYGKGLRNNGYHAIDLFNFFLGKLIYINPLCKKNDFSRNDNTQTVFLKYEKCSQVFLVSLDHRYFTHFEIEIFTDKKKYLISGNETCYISNVKNEKKEIFFSKPKVLKINHKSHINNLIDYSIDVFKQKKIGNIKNIIEVEKVLKLIESYEVENKN